MKIGIHTHPLYTNYGGLLQAYALQTVLKKMGHEVLTIDRSINETPLYLRILSMVKRWFTNVFFRKSIPIRVWLTANETKIISQHTYRFIKEHINLTEQIDTIKKFQLLKTYGFEAYIVGSDQVWRPSITPGVTHYFLDFLNKSDKVKRIAYAASFGVSNWEFSSNQTIQCAILAKQFHAISVREDSAISLCKEYLGVDAIQVLDPTLLLKKEDYIKLVKKDNISKSKGSLLTYILDKSSENSKIVQAISQELGLEPFSVMPKKRFSETGSKNIEDCIFPPVTEWIRGFMDADFVVTDSFHGTAFSIIFNKPFISIGNTGRGLTRFKSFLKIFELEERLILSFSEFTTAKINAEIDYVRINQILKEQQQQTFNFITESLIN